MEIISFLALCLLGFGAAAAASPAYSKTPSSGGIFVHGVGYPIEIPVQPQAAGLQVTVPPLDTRSVTPADIQEARLSCNSVMPVNRVVVCAIETFDRCGNPLGHAFNASVWTVTVQHLTKGVYSKHVSQVTYVELGVAKFYWTGWVSGLYKVSAWQKPNNRFPPLRTPKLMVTNVLVFDTTAQCTVAFSSLTAQLQQTLWNQAVANAADRAVPGIPTPAKRSAFAVSGSSLDPSFTDEQERAPRPPISPFVAPTAIESGQYPGVDRVQYLCEYTQRLI